MDSNASRVLERGLLSAVYARASKECAINIPTADLARTLVKCGKISGQDTDKFRALKLSPVAAQKIKAPLVAECFANLECRLADAGMVKKYNLFVFEVVKAWIDPKGGKNPKTLHHRGNGVFAVDGKLIRLPFRSRA